MAATKAKFLCPNCGEFFPSLVEDTGWCLNCSDKYRANTYTQFELFLIAHADHIEHFILRGETTTTAILKVRQSLRPICASCGGSIKRGGANSVFCRTKPQCRRAAKRYTYLYEKGMTKPSALAQVLTEINGSD